MGRLRKMGEDDMAEMDPLHSPFPLSHWPRGRGKQINNLLCSSAQRQKASLRGERVRTSQPQSLVFAQKRKRKIPLSSAWDEGNIPEVFIGNCLGFYVIEIPIPLAAPPPAHNPTIEIISVPRWKSGKAEQERTLTEKDPAGREPSTTAGKRVLGLDLWRRKKEFISSSTPSSQPGNPSRNGGRTEEKRASPLRPISLTTPATISRIEREREKRGRGWFANGKRRFSLPNRRGGSVSLKNDVFSPFVKKKVFVR